MTWGVGILNKPVKRLIDLLDLEVSQHRAAQLNITHGVPEIDVPDQD